MKTITLARKPISQSVAKNVLEHGCGASRFFKQVKP